MISFQQIRKFFLTIVLTTMLAITIGFDFGHVDSWAAAFRPKVISQPQRPIATLNQADTITNNAIGKNRVTEKS